MTDQSNLPAMPADLGDLEDGRNRAIGHWMTAYDTFHQTTALAAAASVGGALSLHIPEATYDKGPNALARAFVKSGEVERWQGHQRVKEDAREVFERLVTHNVDRACWANLMEKLGFDQLLDRQAREEFQTSLRDEPPAFTRENCAATFGDIWGNRRDFYLRGIANVFMKMDRRFRSHDAFAIGSRLIIERALNEWGGWENYNRRDTLHDVERIFRELDGLGPLGHDAGIAGAVAAAAKSEATPFLLQGDYFRVRIFGNGNLHLWFERKDLLDQVNALLLEYYKPVEGETVEDGPSYEAGPLFHSTPAKYFGAFNTSEEIAARVVDKAELFDGCTVLEPSAGTGMLAKEARKQGARVTCIEIQPGLAAGLCRDGFDTYERNFLDCDPSAYPSFDRIVMNPPFDRGRDCDHVRHAFRFLKPGGRLVAIMSARAEFATDARHKALHDLISQCHKGRESWRWQDLPEKSFAHAGTNVNTVMLTIEKPRG